jgi:phosphate/sulfate permease
MMKTLRKLEYVGWIFWGIMFALLIYPCYLLACQITVEDSTVTRWGLAIFASAIVAGLISWGLNEVLYRLVMRRHNEKRKTERKDKRRKKRK